MPTRPRIEALRIVHYPDPVLRRQAEPVREADTFLRELAERMNELMAEAAGIGLAANQLGVAERLLIVNLTGEEGRYEGFINPVIVSRSGTAREEEGCLSVPGLVGKVRRAERVVVEATRLDGERVRMEAEGLAARCWQHELDHLDGMLFIDKLGAARRMTIRPRLRALKKRFDEERQK